MSLQRTASSTASAMFRFAAAPSPALRRCEQCMRPFSSQQILRQSSRRQLQTATAYRPTTLDPPMPPPRNTGIPGSSIAGGLRQDELSQKQPRRAADNVQEQRSQNQSSVSVTEGEAQKSQPVHQTSTASVATPQPSPSSKPRKSKLRPRKAAMNLSPKAVEKLKEMMGQPEPKLIRVGVKNRGCSGLAYHLEYVDKPGMFDEAVEQDGVKVLIDSKALFSIIGSEMDWIEDKLNQRFIFKNPNITEQCGCGESFSIS